MTTDPVCGVKIAEGMAAAERAYQGERYQFCSDSCLEEFERHPERYAFEDQPAVAAS